MTHIGVIFCVWATKDYLAQSLAPWIELRRIGQIKVSICAVNVLFAGFEGKDDGTRELLKGYLDRGEIDHVIDGPDNMPETTARGMALTWLKEKGCDVSWMVDSDEMYTAAQVETILTFVYANPFVAWFRLSLRNHVFDDKTYLVEPFTPPRIHRVRVDGYQAHSFSADNDIVYGGTITRDIIPQDRFPSMTVPESIAAIKHLTWLNDTPENRVRSHRKIEYQLKARGWPSCSFAWDDSKGGLIFNPALPTPRVVREP